MAERNNVALTQAFSQMRSGRNYAGFPEVRPHRLETGALLRSHPVDGQNCATDTIQQMRGSGGPQGQDIRLWTGLTAYSPPRPPRSATTKAAMQVSCPRETRPRRQRIVPPRHLQRVRAGSRPTGTCPVPATSRLKRREWAEYQSHRGRVRGLLRSDRTARRVSKLGRAAIRP
jgi:hypothetical protein